MRLKQNENKDKGVTKVEPLDGFVKITVMQIRPGVFFHILYNST